MISTGKIPEQKKNSIWLSSVFISGILSFFAYIYLIQTPALPRRDILITLLTWLALCPIVYLLLTRVLLPNFSKYTRRSQGLWLLISALFGLLIIIITIQPAYIYSLLQKHTLEISLPEGVSDGPVTLKWFTTSLGDVSFSQIQKSGDWQLTSDGIVHTGSSKASLSWIGRSGGSVKLVFQSAPSTTPIIIFLDGNPESLDLGKGENQDVVLSTFLPMEKTSRNVIFLVTWFTSAFLFLVITLFFIKFQLKTTNYKTRGKGAWLLFTLPMIAGWGIYWLTFFPAIMTPDSIRQWGQVINGQFNDALPVVHTLLVILVTRLWFSPAAVIVFQGIALALTVAWGIKLLSDQGLPAWAGWGLAVLFAISPVNGNMVATLWKDIPYSTCLLLFSLMILKIVFSRGAWLSERFTWFWLTLVSLGISLFRLNGLPVPLLSLIILALAYRKQWKMAALSLGFFLGIWLMIQGPVYDLLKVDRNTGFNLQVFIHHIAAHVASGSQLTSTEADLAAGILPLDQWDYDCCTNIPIWRQPAYSEPRFTEKAADIRRLFFSLALKEPEVEFRHLVCVSSLVWELPSHCMLNQEEITSAQPIWIEPNDLGLKENSQLPALVGPLTMITDSPAISRGICCSIPLLYFFTWDCIAPQFSHTERSMHDISYIYCRLLFNQ